MSFPSESPFERGHHDFKPLDQQSSEQRAELAALVSKVREEDVKAKRAVVALGDLRADLEDMEHSAHEDWLREMLSDIRSKITEIHDGLN